MQRLFLFFLLLLAIPSTPFAQGNADCSTASSICKKQVYHFDKTGGEGADNHEADFIACFMNGENFGQAEENSTWITFEIEKSGSLTFAITPHRLDDDIDFVVFKLPANGDCAQKQIVRCMAAGDSKGNALNSPCMGETGLRDGERDTSEDAGCSDPGDNTWLAPLRVLKGEKYTLLVSNVSSSGPGFSIRFSGSAKLPCDEDPPKPVAERPKPRPARETPPPPVPVVQKQVKPESIGGRAVEVGETVKVKARTIKLRIWDSQVEDGDVISVYLGDKKVIDHLFLRTKPQEFEIELPPGNEHYLTVYADDFGKSEPNTARVLIFDGVREQAIDLVAERKKQQSIKIITE
ncbi:MAG: hypothetical protein IPH12_10615 [Saprospirales bacterium]|jgi:hypothetical protein|nr:hypothetical protein [Saprospirales bacterium]MBK8922265.1 hypothetical protein [Saprospirales bacterium]